MMPYCGMFAAALFWAGVRVEHAEEGMTALRMIENDPPDLLVLDLVLPTLDGLSVRGELAAHAETRDIPVVVVTGLPGNFESDLHDDRVLHKPVSPERLVATIRECLSVV